MAQTFSTTYKTIFAKKPIDRAKPCLPNYPEYDERPEGTKWYLPAHKNRMSLEELEQVVHQSQLKSYITSYKAEFGQKKASSDGVISKNLLVEHCDQTFEKEERELLPPLDTSRRILGYMSPSTFGVGLTTYENEFCKEGCKILKQNAKTEKK